MMSQRSRCRRDSVEKRIGKLKSVDCCAGRHLSEGIYQWMFKGLAGNRFGEKDKSNKLLKTVFQERFTKCSNHSLKGNRDIFRFLEWLKDLQVTPKTYLCSQYLCSLYD